MKSLTPLLHVQDMVESLAFYEAVGFDLEQQMPDQGVPDWAYLVHGPVHLMLQSTAEQRAVQRLERDPEHDLILHIGHSDLVGFYTMLKELGMPVTEMAAEGLAEFLLTDPDGYRLIFFLDEA